MNKFMEKIAVEHIVLMIALMLFFGFWAIAMMPAILMWHDIKKYRFTVILIVVCCLGYTLGKTTAEIHNEKYKAEMLGYIYQLSIDS